jgi:cytosine/adenosine deaminase-related metal-dependent hydrolase
MENLSIAIEEAKIVTMNGKREIFKGSILIRDGRIAEISKAKGRIEADIEIRGKGKMIIPGLIQTHIHCCQTLFRGRAEDMELLDWLEKRIYNFEASHTPQSIYDSAMLSALELLNSGTTTILDMETTHHTVHAIKALEGSGIRAFTGKALMDRNAPEALIDDTDKAISEAESLIRRTSSERIRYVLNPRFVLSCSEELLFRCLELAQRYGLLIHTHAAENREEVKAVEKEKGMGNIEYFNRIGLLGKNLVLAHCIWLDEKEKKMIQGTSTKVAHCPSANLKLGSGIAPVPEYVKKGITVGLGSDGAPCNNTLDAFKEARLACLIQKLNNKDKGMEGISAQKAFEMLTVDGAKSLGMEGEIGSIEKGKRADLVILDLKKPNVMPHADPYTMLVYEMGKENVEHVFVDGELIVEEGVNRRIAEDFLTGLEERYPWKSSI